MAWYATEFFLKSTLILSTQQSIEVPNPAAELWFSNKEVLEVKNLAKSVVLKPKKPGLIFATGLKSQKNPQRILVLKSGDYQALKKCPLKEIQSDRYPLTLESLNEKTLEKITRCGFMEMALSTEKDEGFEKVESSLAYQGISVIGKKWREGRRELHVPKSISLERVQAALGPYRPFYKIFQVQGIRPGDNLIFHLTLMEFSRSLAIKKGIDLPRGVKILPLEGGISFPDSHMQDGHAILLADWGESQGVSKVLARPIIRTRPGQKAEFMSGGEVPYTSKSGWSNKVEWKEYGLKINLTPDASLKSGDGEIRVNFQVELSDLDYSRGEDLPPSLTRRELHSEFDLRSNEVTLLSSMIQSRSGKGRTSPMGLASIPLLGGLFARSSKDKSDFELWFALKASWEEHFPADYEKRIAQSIEEESFL